MPLIILIINGTLKNIKFPVKCENLFFLTFMWKYLSYMTVPVKKCSHIYLSSSVFPPPINFDTGLSTHIQGFVLFSVFCVCLVQCLKKIWIAMVRKERKKNICPMEVHIDRKKIDWKLKLISLEICMLYEIFFLTRRRVRYCAKFKQKYTTQ